MLIDTHRAWRARPNARRLDLFLADAYPVILRTLRRMLKGAAVYEDIAQLCMVKVTEGALFTFKATGEIESWLETIAKNEAIDYLREPHHRELLAHDTHRQPHLEGVVRTTPEDALLHGENCERLEEVFTYMREQNQRRYVRVLRAFYLNGQSLEQIAEDEGLKYHPGRGNGGPVKDLIHRARAAFKIALKESRR